LRDGILNVAFLPREPVGQPRASASAVAGVAGAAEMPADFGGGGGGGSPSEGSSSTYRSAFHGGMHVLTTALSPLPHRYVSECLPWWRRLSASAGEDL